MNIQDYPSTPLSNSKPATGMSNPAKHLIVDAVNNGWVIARVNAEGRKMGQYVCMTQSEVSGTVVGLLGDGVPLKETFAALEKRDELIVNIMNDLRSARSDAEHYKAFSEQCNEENARLKQARGDRDTLIKRVDELIKQREAAIAGWAKEAAARQCRTTAGDYQQGFDDGRVKIQTELKKAQAELHEAKLRCDSLASGQNVLRNEKAQYRGELQVAHVRLANVQAKLKESNRVRSELCATVLAKEIQIAKVTKERDEARHAAYHDGYTMGQKNAREGWTANDTSVKVLPELPEPIQFAAGDVWRTDSGTIRCISSVSPLVYTQSCDKLNPNHLSIQSLDLKTLRDLLNLEGRPRVYRNAFSPARFLGEPAEGFMVGDVWHKPRSGGFRRITAVSNDWVEYDFRASEKDTSPEIHKHTREYGGWAPSGMQMENATLERK